MIHAFVKTPVIEGVPEVIAVVEVQIEDCEEPQETGEVADVLLSEQRIVEEECLETSRRCIGLLKVTEDSGISAAAELTSQGSQLQRIERQLDGVDAELQMNARDIRGMKSWLGRLKNFARKKSRKRSSPAVVTPTRTDSPVDNCPRLHPRNAFTPPPRPSDADDRVKVILDRHLDDILSSVAFLKQLAEDLAKELHDQEETNQRVTSKMASAKGDIKHQNHQLAKLL